MEQTKEKLLKLLLVINITVSTLALAGVGFLIYKDYSQTQSRGNMPSGNFQPGNMPSQDSSSSDSSSAETQSFE